VGSRPGTVWLERCGEKQALAHANGLILDPEPRLL